MSQDVSSGPSLRGQTSRIDGRSPSGNISWLCWCWRHPACASASGVDRKFYVALRSKDFLLCFNATLAGRILLPLVVFRLVVDRPRASRSSSHRDERRERCRVRRGMLGTPCGYRTSYAGNSTRTFQSTSALVQSLILFLTAPHLVVYLSLLFRQQRVVDVEASLKPTATAVAARATLGLGSLHQKPRVGGTLRPGATKLGGEFFTLQSTIPCLSRRLVLSFVMHLEQCTRWHVLYFQTGSFSCLKRVDTTLRRPRRQLLRQWQSLCVDDARRSSSGLGPSGALFFFRPAGFNSCSSRHWAPSREPSSKLGLKKQRVVDVVTDLPPLGVRVPYIV